MNKKAQALATLQAMIGPLIGVALVLAIGFLIMAEVATQAEEIEGVESYSANATDDVQNAISDIPGWLPIVVVAVIGIALLGLVQMFRSGR